MVELQRGLNFPYVEVNLRGTVAPMPGAQRETRDTGYHCNSQRDKKADRKVHGCDGLRRFGYFDTSSKPTPANGSCWPIGVSHSRLARMALSTFVTIVPDNAAMRLVLIFAYALLLAMPAGAGAATRESVDTLFASMQMDKSWDASMLVMKDALGRQFAQARAGAPTPPDQQRLDAAIDRAWALMRSDLGWPALGAEISQIYADVFTQDDIDAMNAFYGSPTGRAVMSKTPELIGAMMQERGDLAHNDVLTPEESAAFEAFMHSPAAESMKAKGALVRQRVARVTQAHLAHLRPQMQQILQGLQQ